ncbi:hypothetical protein M407DRAFT_218173 [Tulasnella calospora MUT 4182]|uniref:Uncharacterized protein n=1 Tax=Tulasnella calospora MUT 4182 TaxID=1051891 RepID=A0A0C3LJD0_9AGAM|nr:hypothetical protein M407DRAFT_218173 [Tulasnella calospora MUT 4182]
MRHPIDFSTYDRLTVERVTNTSIGPFDQLTVISQRAINDQLALMWKSPQSILRKIEVRPRPELTDYYFVADLNPPTVKLLTGSNKQQVVFYINIQSGTVGYYEGVGPEATPKKAQLGESTIAFRVNLAFDQLAANGVPENIQKALKKPGDYTVQQLLFDFTTAELIPKLNGVDKNESDFTISQEAQDPFYSLVQDYLGVLQKKDPSGNPAEHSILHYAVTAKNSRAFTAAPTCAPTDLNFQNLPFVIYDSDRTSETPVLEGKNAMLVYLQMTNGHKMPNSLLEPTANWVMPPYDKTSESYDSTVCLSKAIFLDGFLLPRLASFNRDSTWVVDEAWWKAENAGFSTRYNISGHVGLTSKDLEDPFFQDYQWKLTSQENGTRNYEYKKTHRKDNDEGLWRVYQEGRTSNSLKVPEGFDEYSTCAMTLSGSTEVETYLHLDGIGDIGKATGKVKCTWEAYLVLDGVDDGVLKIKVESPKVNVTTDNDTSFAYPHILDDTVTRCSNMFKDSNFYDIKAGLEGLFGHSWAFVFSQVLDFYID